MKKKIIFNVVLISYYIVLLFLPFVNQPNFKLSFFFLNYSNDLWHAEELKLINIMLSIILVIYIVTTILLILAIAIKRAKCFKLLDTVSVSIIFALYTFFVVYYSESGYPSWSFYLSLLLLLGWVAHIFSPKWLPFIKKAFAKFHSKHPTKAERIAQLEREVEELKKEDTDSSISSKED